LGNKRGVVSYAMTSARNSRTTQLYVNLKDNSFLDPQRFAGFGTISEEDMKIFDKVNAEYGQRPDQGQIYARGNAYLKQSFPNLSYLKRVIVQ
jgi:peptidyl-prolyl cis-trans isomerase A (cyclophilin A)